MTKTLPRSIAMAATCALLAQSVTAVAGQPLPGSVRDLVGARASSGESTLETRGFTYMSGSTRGGQKLSYWWNGNTKECIRTATADGNFAQITVAPKQDCGQKSGDGNAAAAAAVGAAALIGVLALSHKSHDHRDGNHYSDAANESQYERGYRDGLYNQSYHNYDRSNAYSDGYENGVRERGEQTSYRSGHHWGGGYSNYVSLRDLRGRDRPYVMGQLSSRGFVQRDNKKTEDGRYMTYWREASRQCVIVHSNSGVVNAIDETSEQTCSW